MSNTIKGMMSCKVCGRDFPLISEEHYISREDSVSGLTAIVSHTEPSIWDSFDCPHCGCQNRVQQRKYLYMAVDQIIDLDPEEKE